MYREGTISTNNQRVGGEPGHSGASANNSTENLFNLIQATKTKNTMILEPLSKRHKKTDSLHGGRENELVSRDEIGSGLQARGAIEDRTGPLSQKSHRMRQTDYSRGGFMSNLDIDNGTTAEMNPAEAIRHKTGIVVNGGEPGSPSKVFRSWSRPQISSDLQDIPSHQVDG